jgi:putative membrane protein
MILWIKSFHLIFVVAWFAGLLYLPRLFVYHAACEDAAGRARFVLMERRLYLGIMTPAMAGALAFGLWLFAVASPAVWRGQWWLGVKLILVAALIAHHIACGFFRRSFARDSNRRSPRFFKWFNEAPAVLLIAIVILAVVKPF